MAQILLSWSGMRRPSWTRSLEAQSQPIFPSSSPANSSSSSTSRQPRRSALRVRRRCSWEQTRLFSNVARLSLEPTQKRKEADMPTREEVAKQPLEQRLGRRSHTAEDLAAAIRGQSEAALVRRPDCKNWAANEVICHLRDIEEGDLV